MDLAEEAAFALGKLQVSPSTCTVCWPEGQEVLQPRVMQALVLLAKANGAVVSRDGLIAACWDGRVVGEDAITRVMVQLRQLAHRTGGAAFSLQTIPRVGYQLTAADSEVAPPRPGFRLGRRTLIAGGAAAALIAGAGAVAVWDWRRPGRQEPLTLAVLPFNNLSIDPGTAYLSAGLTRAVRDGLSQIGGLRVIADASSSALSEKKLSLAEIARRLGADLLLTGAVTENAGAVRISLELVDPKSGLEVWSRTTDGRVDDLFRLLDTASAEALAALSARVGPDRLRAPSAQRPRNPIAFRNILEADDLLERTRTLRMVGNDAEGLDAADRAWDLAQASLKIDPNDVGALLVVATLTRNGWTRALAAQPATQAERAAASADVIRRALTADPNDPAALAALGDYYRRFEWRWKEAETLFRRAIAGNPNLIEAHWAYGYELGELGRSKEGLVHAREVFRLDPEDPYRRIALPRLLYLVEGGREAALKRYDIELAAAPENVFLVQEIYQTYLAEGNVGALRRFKAKVAELWKGRQVPPKISALMTRTDAAVAALRGAPDRLVALVDADVAAYDAAGRGVAATQHGRASVDLLYIWALEYGWAGATGRALDLLARALAGHSLYYVAALPYGPAEFPEPMRSDPRYAALWRSDPHLIELMESRRSARAAGQTAGPVKRGPDWS
ncbi:winged helix-turn-helix domain-containing protein [Phenylobacterium sp.]|uniref:winged helix-turn-helix domain-containing protein n=1 Tax=Phenylobacterium sp. TaxID=1871053 RepID=UPI002CA4DFE8|nr:winged helix-turn-helix domain-containing protein [Phenylobacterium sp.]HLZ74946.1 winged helix-turn-helix domain-containing protein [Phenylobacterium sp.]